MSGRLAARRGFASAIAVLLLALGCGCGDDDGPANPSDGTVVRGVVRDASNGSPVKNAKVSFRSDTLDEESDRTNDDGEFSMTVFSRSDSGRLEARKAGFTSTVVSVYLDDADVTIDIDLERN